MISFGNLYSQCCYSAIVYCILAVATMKVFSKILHNVCEATSDQEHWRRRPKFELYQHFNVSDVITFIRSQCFRSIGQEGANANRELGGWMTWRLNQKFWKSVDSTNFMVFKYLLLIFNIIINFNSFSHQMGFVGAELTAKVFD